MAWMGGIVSVRVANHPGRQEEDDAEAGWKGDGSSDILVSRSIWVLLDQLGPVLFLFSSS